MFGSALFTLAPLLTYLTLDTNLAGITLSYGILSGSATNIIMVPTLLIPVTWFPEHKGKILGIITSSFVLSSFLITYTQFMRVLLTQDLHILKQRRFWRKSATLSFTWPLYMLLFFY